MKKQIRMLFAAMLITAVSVTSVQAANTAYTETQQQSHSVRGVVKDAIGPMAGVNVLIKGTTTGMKSGRFLQSSECSGRGDT